MFYMLVLIPGVASADPSGHHLQQRSKAMSLLDSGMQQPGAGGMRAASAQGMHSTAAGAGWVLFAGIMIAIVSVLNIIYGIAAIGNSNFFVNDQKYIISELNTWGWVSLVLGGFQMVAAFSIWNGNGFGRWLGIATAGASTIAALLSLPAYPFWSLAIFAIDIMVIYGLAAYGGRHQAV